MTAPTATHLLTLPAARLATAWLNAFLATGQDESRPALCRTLSLEFFQNGLQLIGCDGTILFRTWTPEFGHEETEWPDMAEDPLRRIVVMDPDGFGLAFMRTLLSSANASEHPELLDVTFDIDAVDDEDEPALGDVLRPQRLIIGAFGQHLELRLFEDEYPNWRRAMFGIDPAELVDQMRIALRMMKTVAKLKGVGALNLEFLGEDRQIRFHSGPADAPVAGLIMPMRRAEERKAKPSEPVEPDEDEL